MVWKTINFNEQPTLPFLNELKQSCLHEADKHVRIAHDTDKKITNVIQHNSILE